MGVAGGSVRPFAFGGAVVSAGGDGSESELAGCEAVSASALESPGLLCGTEFCPKAVSDEVVACEGALCGGVACPAEGSAGLDAAPLGGGVALLLAPA